MGNQIAQRCRALMQRKSAPEDPGHGRVKTWFGALGLTVVTVLVVLAGVAAATIIHQPGGSGSGIDEVVAWDGSPPTIAVNVPDPEGLERWALREYRSKAGLPCLEVGRLKGDGPDAEDFGRVNDDGSFTALAVEDGGSAVDLSGSSHALLVDHYPATHARPAQAAIFGMAKEVRSVVLHTASGSAPIPVEDGVFLEVRGEAELRDASVEFVGVDGARTTYDLRSHVPLDIPVDPPLEAGTR